MMNDSIEYIVELAKKTGAACATVSDGHVIVLSRNRLKELLEKENNDSELVVIFVKRTPDNMKN